MGDRDPCKGRGEALDRVVGVILLVVVVSAVAGNVFASRRRSRFQLSLPDLVRDRLGRAPPGTTTQVWTALADALRSAPPADPDGVLRLRLARSIDEGEYRPRLSDDTEIKEFSLRWGNDYAMIGNRRDLVYFRLHPDDLAIARLMDGTRTVKEIVVERLSASGDMQIEDVTDVVALLRDGNFLDPPFVDTVAALTRSLGPPTTALRKVQTFAKTLTIEWRGADRLVRWFYRYGIRWFFVPPVAIAAGLVAVLGLVAFFDLRVSGRFGFTGESAVAESLILLGLSYSLTFAHELGHAVVLTHYGRKVKSAGFGIYFGSPSFFVESSDGLMLERGQRILQAFAGPFAESILAGAAALVVWAFPESPAAGVLYKLAALNYFIIFLNLIPLLELDGYWIVSDLIQVPDLRPRSLAFLQHDLVRKLRERERFTRTEIGLALYGILGVAFTFVALGWSAIFWWRLFGGLVRALWNGGTATRLLLVATALFVLGPVLRGAIDLVRGAARRVRALVRRVRFRLETRWRVEAAELIDALPAFEDLPEDLLSELAGRVRLRTYRRGQPVVRQGERASAFFVVRRGRLDVIEEDPGGGSRVLRSLTRGDSFGELGLLEASPRAATVRATEESEVFEVGKGTFDRLLADEIRAPQFGPTLQAVAELGELSAFAHLGGGELGDLLEHGAWMNVAPGETIVEQGEAGDAFYVLRSGRAQVLKDGAVIRTLEPGSYFGEIALLEDVPRTATVVARTPVRAFRLDREGFDRLVGEAFRKGSLRTFARDDRTWQH
jgi:CRP-like cAMP-binding protein/Zn-dependent protease